MRVNFRPGCIIALSLSLGILAGFITLIYPESKVYLIAFAAISILSLLATLVWRGTLLRPKAAITAKWALMSAILLGMGFMLFYLSYAMQSNITQYDQEVQVAGIVRDRYTAKDGNYYFLLQDVTIADNDGIDAADAGGKLFVYVNSAPGEKSPNSGQRVQFSAKLSAVQMLSDGSINSYALRNNIKYNAYIAQEDIFILESNSGGVMLSARIWLREQLLFNMRKDNADISYALIVGDSLYIDSGLKATFNDSGIAHIFSVSGLHVGVLSAAIVTVLRKFRAGAKTILSTNIILLCLYAALCGFAPSVTRSLIMIIIYLAAGAWGKKYDGLSSVSVAVIIILLLNPLTLFDAGFLLSICAVYSIFLLKRPIERLLKNVRILPGKFISALSVTLAAQIGITPVLCAYFGNLPMLAVLLNLIAVPLVSVVYVALLVIVPLAALLSPAALLYMSAGGLLEIVKLIVAALDRTGLYVLTARALPVLAVVCFYALILCASDVVRFIKRNLKPIICGVLTICIALVYGLSYRPYTGSYASIAAINAPSGYYGIVTDNDSTALVCYGGTEIEFEELRLFLYQNSIYNIDTAVSFHSASSTITLFRMLAAEYGLKHAALPHGDNSQYIVDNMQHMEIKLLLSGERYVYKNLQFAAYYYNAEYYAGIAIVQGRTALYLMDTGDKSLSYLFTAMFFDIDILLSHRYNASIMAHYRPSVYVYGDAKPPRFNALYSTQLSGSLIFRIENDSILRKYSYRNRFID